MTDNIPNFIYGTAWKKEATANLVELALKSGFRAIDTANQAKHYSESLVGDALINAAKNGISREQIWLQSKFTSIDGQDTRLPYNPKADLTTQVKQSFASTLEHLHTNYLDSFAGRHLQSLLLLVGFCKPDLLFSNFSNFNKHRSVLQMKTSDEMLFKSENNA